jgi:hypothetical protein
MDMPTFSEWYRNTSHEAASIEQAAQDAFNAALEIAARICEEKYAAHSPQSKFRKAADSLAQDIRDFLG